MSKSIKRRISEAITHYEVTGKLPKTEGRRGKSRKDASDFDYMRPAFDPLDSKTDDATGSYLKDLMDDVELKLKGDKLELFKMIYRQGYTINEASILLMVSRPTAYKMLQGVNKVAKDLHEKAL